MSVKPIPDGYEGVTPYLIVDGGAGAIEFYRNAFGAEEIFRLEMPGGRLGHAEMRIGRAHFMLADEFPEMDIRGPRSIGGNPVSLLFYVENADAAFERAVAAGATVRRPMKDQFYGDRSGTIEDPYGHVWTIATHVEDIPPEEMRRRSEQAMKEMGTA